MEVRLHSRRKAIGGQFGGILGVIGSGGNLSTTGLDVGHSPLWV